jgi:site-specific DNA-cytosine methylase
LCSGIEAATVAWKPLGWTPAWFSEIKPFPKEVLKLTYPEIPDLGDMLNLNDNKIFQESKIDLLVAGTPCQPFSLAGGRKGLKDERGDLTLRYIRIIDAKRPRWFIWENVPGVMSLNRGRDFGAILREMVKLRYGVAYRILDAKYFGLPQARPRVFVVGHIGGDWSVPAKVLCISSTCHNYNSRSTNAEGRIPTLTLRNAGNKNARGVAVVETVVPRDGEDRERPASRWGLRACTPWEEERRQGFSGEYTAISGASDKDRYEAIGNSMAVPVMRWIGEQIEKADKGEQ